MSTPEKNLLTLNWPILPKKITPIRVMVLFFRAFIVQSAVVLIPFRFVSASLE